MKCTNCGFVARPGICYVQDDPGRLTCPDCGHPLSYLAPAPPRTSLTVQHAREIMIAAREGPRLEQFNEDQKKLAKMLGIKPTR